MSGNNRQTVWNMWRSNITSKHTTITGDLNNISSCRKCSTMFIKGRTYISGFLSIVVLRLRSYWSENYFSKYNPLDKALRLNIFSFSLYRPCFLIFIYLFFTLFIFSGGECINLIIGRHMAIEKYYTKCFPGVKINYHLKENACHLAHKTFRIYRST